jgi:outer membrane protein, multidrug efflux system
MVFDPRCAPDAAPARRPKHGIRPAAKLASLLVAATVLAACTAVGPDYAPPATQMPDFWHQELTRGLATGDADLQTWWTTLDDPTLNGLVDRAAQGNLDVRQALARVQAARALIGVASGEQLPSIDASGVVEYGRISEGISPNLAGRSRNDTLFSTGLDATWEIDFWGRIARSVESADADFQASVEDYRDALVVLYAEVASTYVDVRTLQQRIRSALGNVQTQQQTLRLVQERRRAGLASDLEVAQARLNLSRTESAVPPLREALGRSVHQLGVLLGEPPSALYAMLGEVEPIPDVPADVVVGLPHELLRQRPDVRGAERQLAAQTARIGVATADLYPRFSLFGFFAFEAFDAGMWFNGGSLAYGLGPSVRWNLFDGGRVRSRIDVEDALAQQQLAAYEQAVLNALREVEDAMVGFAQEQQRRDALARSVDAARTATRLVSELYITGLTDFQNVQDTERNRFEQEDQFAESEGRVVQNLIALYKALGGGWDTEGIRTSESPPGALPPGTAAVPEAAGSSPSPTAGEAPAASKGPGAT